MKLKRYFSALLAAFMIFVTVCSDVTYVKAEELTETIETESSEVVEEGTTDVSVEYLIVDQPNVVRGDSQKIVVGLSSESELMSVSLNYHNESTGTEYQIEGEEHSDGMFLFDVVYEDSSETGEYVVDSINYVVDDKEHTIILADLAIDARWGVETDVETSPDDYIVEEESLEDSIEASVVDENGELVEADSISDAIEQANDGEVTHYAAGKNFVIVLDPGHDSKHAGAQRNGYDEATLNFKIANYCKAALEQYKNVTVYMTRNSLACPHPGTSSTQDNAARVAYAASVGANVYVSIHLNVSSNSSVSGAEVYYPNGNFNGAVGATGSGLASSVLAELANIGLKNRGTYIRNSEDNTKYPDGSLSDYYGVIRRSKLNGFPGIIIEHAYLSSASDRANYLSSEASLKSIGEADAKGIANYYGLSTKMDLTGVFDAKYYADTYSDLKTAYGYDEDRLYNHFINYGIYEGRQASPIFNINYYMNKYSDLRNAFGSDRFTYVEHFMADGMKEGRQASNLFNVYSYKNLYPDLRQVYGNNLKLYYLHFVDCGYKEGRVAKGYENTVVAATSYKGIDYSAVYDYNYYANKYPDLKAAFGSNDTLYIQHFVENGMKEGRQAKSIFDVHSYMLQYSDLRRTFGNNLKDYYLHYMSCGKSEGRAGTGCTTMTGATTVYKGVDYSSIYNYNYYVGKYTDLQSAFAYDDAAALEHFVNCGMTEGRQAKKTFDVRSYMLQYSDLRRAFGNDLKSYYLHYMSCGKSERRVGTGCTTMTDATTVYKGIDYSSIYNYNYYVGKYTDLKSVFAYDDAAALEHFVKYGMSEGRQADALFDVYTYKNNYVDLQNAFGNDLKSYYLHYINCGKKEGRVAS